MVLKRKCCSKKKKKEKFCDRCPDRCVSPAVIQKDLIDKSNFFDFTCNDTFSVFQNQENVQPYKGATIDFDDKKTLLVKYNKCDGGPSPGFVILLKTDPCQKYTVNLTAFLKEGDKAFVQVESLHPPGKLVKDNHTVGNGLLQNLEFSFQAVSKFTVIGIFFFCETRDYCLRICDFVIKSCRVCDPCPIVCEPWKKPHRLCKHGKEHCHPCHSQCH